MEGVIAVKVLTAQAMREADRRTIEEVGLPGIVLMETAGMRATEVILSLRPRPQRVTVVAGPGNNGGDGLVVTRLLERAGIQVSLWCTVPPGSYGGDALTNYNYLMHRAYPIRHILEYGDLEHLRTDLERTGLVVDALLGTGVDRPVEGIMADVVAAINGSGAPVLSLDIPSGINADNGAVLGCAVRARWTITFGYPKHGLLLFPGADYAGAVIVGEIHIPPYLVEEEQCEIVTFRKVNEMLPSRPQDAHKGTFGRVLVVAGSTGMSGAAALAAESALRGGAGLVYLAAPAGICAVLDARLVEVITIPLPECSPGVLAAESAGLILELAGKCDAVALGPGLNPGGAAAGVLHEVIGRCKAPLVLDAGGLDALGGLPSNLQQAKRPPVITPHAGEMARLTGVELTALQYERRETALRYARAWNCILVLKGAHTIIACPGGELYYNPTGGPALATAGTGDLLAGLITSLAAQGMPPEKAAQAAVYMHGLSGDLIGSERGHTAREVMNHYKDAFDMLGQEFMTSWGPYNTALRPVR